ncbi:unnamed protein product [Brassicogethes aeneus]|uniref:C2H2-type domain-containing protein n=1 Tax=Brassicogethes aeneus TaxID=1431903 RepID=A0A9P0FAD4_BRAAE|nr:unnamed protein product [Brassicogethes aeneus]
MLNKWSNSLPAHLMLPMMIMRENMQKSMTNSDLTLSPIASPSKKNSLTPEAGFSCPDCDRVYKLKSSLRNHRKWECGKRASIRVPTLFLQGQAKDASVTSHGSNAQRYRLFRFK